MFRNILMSLEFSADAKQKIAAACERYQVSASKKPVVMYALHLAQKEHGHLSDDALKLVAPRSTCRTRTSMASRRFTRCTAANRAARIRSGCARTISCMLRGGYDVLAAFEQKLGLKKGQSNRTSRSLKEECIAACANAPCAVVGTKYYLDLTPADVDKVIAELKANPHPESEVL